MLSVENILLVGGYVGLFAIIFAESGVLFGFFLPGDSLLVTAGLLASQGYFNPWLLAILCSVAAVGGDSFGYWFGTVVGPKIFTREKSFFFKPQRLIETKDFFEQHGARTVALARFVPAVRTLTPILAGVGRMPYAMFIKWNVGSGILWAGGLTLGSYYIARVVPGFQKYFSVVIIVVVATSFIPILWRLARSQFQKFFRGDRQPLF